MRALIAAGGTGGHIYPGIAVAKEIVRREPDSEVKFVGTARGLENKLVPQAGFELSLIDSTGLKNVGRRGARPRVLVLLQKVCDRPEPRSVNFGRTWSSAPAVMFRVQFS